MNRLCACGHREREHIKWQDCYSCDGNGKDMWGRQNCSCDNWWPVREKDEARVLSAKAEEESK